MRFWQHMLFLQLTNVVLCAVPYTATSGILVRLQHVVPQLWTLRYVVTEGFRRRNGKLGSRRRAPFLFCRTHQTCGNYFRATAQQRAKKMDNSPQSFTQLLLYAHPGDVAQIFVDSSTGTITKGGADRWTVEIPGKLTQVFGTYAEMSVRLDSVLRRARSAALQLRGETRQFDRGVAPSHVLR